jgi:hypothetical protein
MSASILRFLEPDRALDNFRRQFGRQASGRRSGSLTNLGNARKAFAFSRTVISFQPIYILVTDSDASFCLLMP